MTHVIPFGKYKDFPLPAVPTYYLAWAARECRLSSGLSSAVRAELARRGVTLPEPPPPPPRRCPSHPHALMTAFWLTQRDGRKVIRGECSVPDCRRWLGTLPMTPENVALADTPHTAAVPIQTVCDLLDGLDACEEVRG